MDEQPTLRIHVGAFVPSPMDVRARLPALALAQDPSLRVTYQEAPVYLPQAPRKRVKVFVLQRPWLPELKDWRDLAVECITNGWIMVLETDDHPGVIAEVKGRTLADVDWKSLSYCHAVQTSTPRLAALFCRYNPEVRVFPNAVFDLPPFPEEPRPDRVFYGAVGRGAFATRIAASLGRVVRAFPQVEFVVVGDKAVFDALPTANKRYHDLRPYGEYLDLMRSCTVALCPLEGGRFQECKSDAKFLDAARGGVLTIASPTVYEETITDGVNGLIARTEGDWARLLALALADAGWRSAMARRAWEYVRDNRMFAFQIAERREWYKDLCGRCHQLTEQMIRRCPDLLAHASARSMNG
jgi:hypothetical protein